MERLRERQLLGMIEQKDTEIAEQNTTITSYLEKIGKALIGKHNAWPNEELTTKVHDLTHTEAEAEKSSNECSSSSKWNEKLVKELEGKLASLQKELCYSKTTVAEIEEFFSIVCKLVDRYKESAVEWFRKAEDMDRAFIALQTHLVQTENDYRKKLGEEVFARLLHEKAAADLEEKLKKCDVEIENYRKAKESSLPPISSFTIERWTDRDGAADGLQDSDHMIVPRIPVGVSETALEVSLLRDGWSLAKMYKKYQEAVDALQRESMGRKHSEAVLEMILDKVEQYAILVERDDGGKLPERDLHNM